MSGTKVEFTRLRGLEHVLIYMRLSTSIALPLTPPVAPLNFLPPGVMVEWCGASRLCTNPLSGKFLPQQTQEVVLSFRGSIASSWVLGGSTKPHVCLLDHHYLPQVHNRSFREKGANPLGRCSDLEVGVLVMVSRPRGGPAGGNAQLLTWRRR